MRIDIQIDAEKLKAKTLREQKRLAFSVAQALNDTAKEVQAEIQGRVKQLFRIRKGKDGSSSSEFSRETGDQPSRSERSFIVRSIKIFAFANVKRGRIFAELGIQNRPRLLLSTFEKGGTREPFVGKNVAVPTEEGARGGSLDNSVAPELTFKRLGFKPHTTTSGKRQIKGKQRTFILSSTAAHPDGGVYQRIGPKKEDVRMIYSFRRAFRLRAVLRFVKTAEAVYIKRFRENFLARFYDLQGRKR